MRLTLNAGKEYVELFLAWDRTWAYKVRVRIATYHLHVMTAEAK
jgi:hypothetical protein